MHGHHEIARMLRKAGAVQHGFLGYKLPSAAARGDIAVLESLLASGYAVTSRFILEIQLNLEIC
jgi:hypothetical protein